jgi:hypothetical protein
MTILRSDGTIHPLSYKSGDLVFCHSKDIVGRGIRLAERLHFRGGSTYNHVATLDMWHMDDNHPDSGYWTVIQAEAHGVTNFRELDEVAPGGTYVVIPTLAPNIDKQIEFLRAQVGTPYGFLTIISILVTIESPKFINVMLPNTWICSAVAAEAMRAGGWIHNWDDLYQVNPAELFEAVTK